MHGDLMHQVCDAVAAGEPRAHITCAITQPISQHALLAGERHAPRRAGARGLPPDRHRAYSTPIRGGTDGSRLTEMGVPTPNLFTGMQDMHGPLEWISVQDMSRAAEMCVKLAQLWVGE